MNSIKTKVGIKGITVSNTTNNMFLLNIASMIDNFKNMSPPIAFMHKSYLSCYFGLQYICSNISLLASFQDQMYLIVYTLNATMMLVISILCSVAPFNWHSNNCLNILKNSNQLKWIMLDCINNKLVLLKLNFSTKLNSGKAHM